MFLKEIVISLDCQQRLTSLRNLINDAIDESWRILSRSPWRAISSSRSLCGGDRWPAIQIPKLFETCSLEFMLGEYAGHSIRRNSFHWKKVIYQACKMWLKVVVHYHEVISSCSSVRNIYTMSENLIPTSTMDKISIPNDVEIGAPISRDASITISLPQLSAFSNVKTGNFLELRSLQKSV